VNEVPETSDVTELRATLAAMPLLDPPPDVLQRWHAALAQLPPPTTATPRSAHAPNDPQAPARGHSRVPAHRLAPDCPAGRGANTRRPDRRRALGAGLLVAAASIVALVAPTDPAPLTLSRADLPDVAWTLRSAQPTAPGDQARLAGCLARLGADGEPVLGSRRVDLEGRPGVLFVLATPIPGRVRTLVVSPDCGPDRGSALADRTSGR
jgi:hypothetical protein